jgi:hypothetical protein
MKNSAHKNSAKINKIEITNDTISGRGGLAFFLRYIQQIQFYTLVENVLSSLKINKKGLPLYQFVKQIMAFFFDKSFKAISGFDELKKDAGYTAVLENKENEMASSHQIKRFFSKLMFNNITNKIYRKILHELFIWRLLKEKPQIIILGGDTMVLDNDDAEQREGAEPTYKKKKGFQPLHITWCWFLIDVVFRTGSKHSNHGTDFIDTVTDIVNLIRTRYNPDVPIVLVADSGFADQKNFQYFEDELKISYITTGPLYENVKNELSNIDFDSYNSFTKKGFWNYCELGIKLDSWERFRRAIFTTMETNENDQFCLEFVKTDSLIYTNIGMDLAMTEQLKQAGGDYLLSANGIIAQSHQRGQDELIHRSIKELALKEQLPFKKLEMNRAYYYFLVFAHILFECYKRDVSYDVLPITSYPDTFRRHLVDFAAKIVDHSGQISLKVTSYISNKLNIFELWKRCQHPPVIQFL